MNLLNVPGKDPIKYAIALMCELFTEEEMAKSCYVETMRTKKPSLPVDKRELLEGSLSFSLILSLSLSPFPSPLLWFLLNG